MKDNLEIYKELRTKYNLEELSDAVLISDNSQDENSKK